MRKYQPAAYMKICALMIPKEMKLEHSGSVIKAMTDEELDTAIAALRDLLARREAAAIGHRNITHTVRYAELRSDRFDGFWKD